MTAPPRLRSADQTLTLDKTEQKFSLSATQVMASMAAAATAALVGSRLGVAGTVIGAGLASVISVVGGAVIGHSILLTRQQVKRAVLQVRGADQDSAATVVLPAAGWAPDPADDRTTVIPAVTRLDLQRVRTGSGPGHAEPGRPRPTEPGPRRVSTGVLLGIAASLAIFVSALGAVTVLETIKGSPLSGGDSGGLSVLGGNGGNPVDVPATTAMVTESATVTQTVTSEITAPTTTPPITTAPTTAAPTTVAPTKSAPTTAAPKTPAPTTAAQIPTAQSAPPTNTPAVAPQQTPAATAAAGRR